MSKEGPARWIIGLKGEKVGNYRRWFLIFFLAGILPLGLYGVYARYQEGVDGNRKIWDDLIYPYGEAVKKGDFPVAYRRFTSTGFQKSCPLPDYLEAQKRNLDEFGPLLVLRLKENDPFQSSFNLFSWTSYHQGSLVYRGTTGEAWVNVQVIEEDGVLKIEAMFQIFHNRLKPRIF